MAYVSASEGFDYIEVRGAHYVTELGSTGQSYTTGPAAAPNNGVGATLKGGGNGALGTVGVVDYNVGDLLLVIGPGTSAGVYIVVSTGDASNPWCFMRIAQWDHQDDQLSIPIYVSETDRAGFWEMETDAPTDWGADTIEFVQQTWQRKNADRVIAHEFNVDAASTANVAGTYASVTTNDEGATLTAAAPAAFPAIDGVTLAQFERVLLKDQSTGLQNGIYVLEVVGDGSTAWVLRRFTGCNDPGSAHGLRCWVRAGTANGGKRFEQTTAAPTIGVSTLTFTEVTSPPAAHTHTNADLTGVPGAEIDTTAIHEDVAGEIAAVAAATVAPGDLVLIEDVDDGDQKKQTTAQDIADLGAAAVGYALSWGANMGSASNNALANGIATAASPGASFDHRTEHTVPKAGTVVALAWNTQLADATTDIKIHKNNDGSPITVDLTGASGAVSGLSLAVAAGDQLAIEFDAGTAPALGTYVVYIE